MGNVLVALDPGHGGEDPGAVGPRGLRESDVVWYLTNFLCVELGTWGHTSRLTRPGDVHASLTDRVQIANTAGADIFLSVHTNGFADPAVGGTETLCFPGSSQGKRLAGHVQRRLIERCGRRNRGIEARRNLVVLARTSMPAILVEVAFITNPVEEQLLGEPHWLHEAARAIALGVADYAPMSD